MSNRAWFYLTLLYMSAILASSLVPGGGGEGSEQGRRAFVMNMLHIPVYALLTFLWLKVFKVSQSHVTSDKSQVRKVPESQGQKSQKAQSQKVTSHISSCDSLALTQDCSASASPQVTCDFVTGEVRPETGDLVTLRTCDLVFAFTIAVLFGILNEFVQATTPGREFSVADMLRNVLGAALAIIGVNSPHLFKNKGVKPKFNN